MLDSICDTTYIPALKAPTPSPLALAHRTYLRRVDGIDRRYRAAVKAAAALSMIAAHEARLAAAREMEADVKAALLEYLDTMKAGGEVPHVVNG